MCVALPHSSPLQKHAPNWLPSARRLHAELAASRSRVEELAAELADLRRAHDLANAARDAATLRQQTQDAALASRDAELVALRAERDAAVSAAERASAAHASAVAQRDEATARLQAQLADAQAEIGELSRASTKAAVDAAALENAASVSRAANLLGEELKAVSAILHDHLAAEGEVAVWYLHTSSRQVASRDVAKSLAALIEETRARIDDLASARWVRLRMTPFLHFEHCFTRCCNCRSSDVGASRVASSAAQQQQEQAQLEEVHVSAPHAVRRV